MSLSYRATPISKKIAQQKRTPFRLTQRRKTAEEGERRRPGARTSCTYARAYIRTVPQFCSCFIYSPENKRGHRAFGRSLFIVAFGKNNSATIKLNRAREDEEREGRPKKKKKKENCFDPRINFRVNKRAAVASHFVLATGG